MSFYSVKKMLLTLNYIKYINLIYLKGKNRNRCLGRNMDHPADSTAELGQGTLECGPTGHSNA